MYTQLLSEEKKQKNSGKRREFAIVVDYSAVSIALIDQRNEFSVGPQLRKDFTDSSRRLLCGENGAARRLMVRSAQNCITVAANRGKKPFSQKVVWLLGAKAYTQREN